MATPHELNNKAGPRSEAGADKADTTYIAELPAEPAHTDAVLRSKADDLTVWEAIKSYKLVSGVAMAAAFCASLDGYQITLNGGIVSNKGFIRQFGGAGVKVLPSKYISAWGGVQSAGQTIGQIGLQFITESLGRKMAMYSLWIVLTGSIFAETFATHWTHWLVAKLFSGIGVGMLQATLPVYLSEMAPTQLRGFLINAYTFWFVLGQLFGSIALNELNQIDPYDFRTAIYSQWAMIGVMIIIFFLLPESPWWLCSKSKTEQAAKVLSRYNGHVKSFNVHETIEVMTATIDEERSLAHLQQQEGLFSVFQGRNFIRFIIASWPKITQQLVGLSVFNTYSTYFFQNSGFKDPFLVTVILGCVQLLSMLITATTTDSFGRRPLTVYPYGITSLSLLALGVVGCFDYGRPELSSLLIFFTCLATFTTTGASAIGYAYAAEVPSQRLRARTAGWALAFSNMVAIIFSFFTPLMIKGTGAGSGWGVKTGFFFAGTGAVAVVIAWFIMPEVARRTPAEIDEMFEKKVNLRKFDKYVTDVQVHAEEVHREEEKVGV